MKRIIFGICVLGFVHSAYSYEKIDEALQNGISNGEIILLGSYVDTDSWGNDAQLLGSDLVKNSYSVANFALAYRSGFYKGMRFMLSFRGSGVIYEDSIEWKNDINSPGRAGALGSSSRDFYAGSSAMLSESYVEYSNDNINIKAGRIYSKHEWNDRLADGLLLKLKIMEKLILEGFWAKQSGYAQYNKMSGFHSLNPYSYSGLMHFSARLNFNDYFSLKAYVVSAPSIFNAIGSKFEGRYEGNMLYFGGNIHGVYSIEDSHSQSKLINTSGKIVDTYVADTRLFIGVKDIFKKHQNSGLEGSIGYISSGKNGLGSLNISGNTISPFFNWGGRAFLLGANTNTFFGKVNVSFDRLTFGLIYGSTNFNNLLDVNTMLRQNDSMYDRINEINSFVELGVSEFTSIMINLQNTHAGAKRYYPHQTTLYFGVRIGF